MGHFNEKRIQSTTRTGKLPKAAKYTADPGRQPKKGVGVVHWLPQAVHEMSDNELASWVSKLTEWASKHSDALTATVASRSDVRQEIESRRLSSSATR